MTELLTGRQMRDIEAAAIESGLVSGLELMERAGAGVVDAVLALWPDLGQGGHHAVVLCGPGNNGGDGFVAARHLDALGWSVAVHLLGDPDKLPPDARRNLDRWQRTGTVLAFSADVIQAGSRPDLVVDAVFGTGLTRPLPDGVALALDRRHWSGWSDPRDIRVVAVECPSGLNLDTGLVPGDEDRATPRPEGLPDPGGAADLTVTFHSPKPGHYLGMGPVFCKRLVCVDIGLTGDALERNSLLGAPDRDRVRLVEPVFRGVALPGAAWPGRLICKTATRGHKYDHGHAVVFAGGSGRGGAGRLAARAALRCGAGLVTVVCPPEAVPENAARLDAIMLRALSGADDLDSVADDRVSAYCIGPGLGVSERTRDLVRAVLSRRTTAAVRRDPVVVLDADALTSFSEAPEALFAILSARTVLTPHEGEFARLFPDLARGQDRDPRSKVDVVRQAAARAGCIVLLKGVDTVIAGPEGGASVHAAVYGREAGWLATAGAGDVLAGMIAGLAAPSCSGEVFNVAEAAAWLHVECARAFGPGLIAEDLPEMLPKVLTRILSGDR